MLFLLAAPLMLVAQAPGTHLSFLHCEVVVFLDLVDYLIPVSFEKKVAAQVFNSLEVSISFMCPARENFKEAPVEFPHMSLLHCDQSTVFSFILILRGLC